MKKINFLLGLLLLSFLSFTNNFSQTDDYQYEGEKHLTNIRMLTDGGENAEAYLSFDENKLIFQATVDDLECDQIFTMNLDGSNKQMVSTGNGRTTCAYYLPGDDKIVYASTHLADDNCPPPPDRSKGYVWQLYDSFDIFYKSLYFSTELYLTKKSDNFTSPLIFFFSFSSTKSLSTKRESTLCFIISNLFLK